jgi:hypothetical protein
MKRLPQIWIGQIFGRWTVESRAANDRNGARWNCRCSCGARRNVSAQVLWSGHFRSCGCLHREVSAVIARANTKHGASARGTTTPEYNAWCGMLRRVLGRDESHRRRYTERGITVCGRWRKSFLDFLADVGPRPSPKYSLDRYPDPNGNYEPGNVRWATAREQARNRANTRMVSIGGVTKPLVEWAELSGLARTALTWRVERGWPPERLLAPSRRRPGRSKTRVQTTEKEKAA